MACLTAVELQESVRWLHRALERDPLVDALDLVPQPCAVGVRSLPACPPAYTCMVNEAWAYALLLLGLYIICPCPAASIA